MRRAWRIRRVVGVLAAAFITVQGAWGGVALAADALGVPGALSWCPLLSDPLGLADESAHAPAAQPEPFNGEPADAHADHGARRDQGHGSKHGEHLGHGDDCPAAMSKADGRILALVSDDGTPLAFPRERIAYAPRLARVEAEKAGPPLGSRAPPLSSSRPTVKT